MSFRTLLVINAVIAAPTGALCALLPEQLLSFYGVSLSAMGQVIYRFWGATLIAFGAQSWLLRDSSEPKVRGAVAVTMALFHGACCSLAVLGQYAGANSRGWSMVALFAALAVAFVLAAPTAFSNSSRRPQQPAREER